MAESKLPLPTERALSRGRFRSISSIERRPASTLPAQTDVPRAMLITGTLISEEFIGSVVTLHLDIGGGAVFRVQKQAHELDTGRRKHAGADVLSASWRAEDTYVLPA